MRRLLSGTFVMATSMGIVAIVLPLYAMDLGASYTEIGLLGVAYVLFAIFMSVPIGRAGDRRGRAPFIVIGFLATASVFLFYPLVKAIFWLIALRLVQGTTEVLIWVNAQGAVADLSASARRGWAMGAYGTSWGMGLGIGSLVGGALYASIGVTPIFLLSAVLAFGATAIVATMPAPRPRVAEGKPKVSSALPAYIAGMIYIGVASVIFTLLPVYATRALGMSGVQAGLLVTLFAGARAGLFMPLGWLSDRVGHRPVILVGMVGASLASAGIALVSGFNAVVAVILVLAAAEGAIYPAVVGMVSKAGAGKNLGYVIGVFNSVTMAGWALFPGAGGVLADVYGPRSPFLMCAVLGLVGAALSWKLMRRR